MKIYILVFVVLIILSLSQTCSGQIPDESLKHSLLNLYLNCGYCYEEFVKTEIKYVNYVRDRQDADLDLLITSQMAGAEGTEYMLFFIGHKRFSKVNDTLKYIANSTNVEDETRKGLIRVIKLGLMR